MKDEVCGSCCLVSWVLEVIRRDFHMWPVKRLWPAVAGVWPSYFLWMPSGYAQCLSSWMPGSHIGP